MRAVVAVRALWSKEQVMQEALARQIEDAVREIADEAAGEATAVIKAQQRVMIAGDALAQQRGARTTGTRLLSAAMACIARDGSHLPPARVADALLDLADSLEDAARSVVVRGGTMGIIPTTARDGEAGPVVGMSLRVAFREVAS